MTARSALPYVVLVWLVLYRGGMVHAHLSVWIYTLYDVQNDMSANVPTFYQALNCVATAATFTQCNNNSNNNDSRGRSREKGSRGPCRLATYCCTSVFTCFILWLSWLLFSIILVGVYVIVACFPSMYVTSFLFRPAVAHILSTCRKQCRSNCIYLSIGQKS